MLKSIELSGFKSFGRKSELTFTSPIAGIVGPNGSGKSNVAEAFRFVLGEQSMKSLRSKKGEDLIWGGSSGMPRSNRASVKIVFDNSAHILPLDFEEVTIERVVFRDGVNEYSINGSKVRLRDITELLSQANIGSSGYHIISQGEADRVLSASPRERREMVEEALGLKLYQHKKAESEKKLEETGMNLEQVASLRRELAPHLTYLRKQVEKIEQAQEIQNDLAGKLSDYLARESAYITREKTRVGGLKDELQKRLEELEHAVSIARGTVSAQSHNVGSEDEAKMTQAESMLTSARHAREEVSRSLGRAEGELSALRSVVAVSSDEEESVPRARIHSFIERVEQAVRAARVADTEEDRSGAFRILETELDAFRKEIGSPLQQGVASGPVKAAFERVSALTRQFEDAQKKESECEQSLSALRAELSVAREEYHTAERELIAKTGEARELGARLSQADEHLADLANLRQRFEEEVREGIVLLGGATLSWQTEVLPPDALLEPRENQESRRRVIERLKIKIEEYRGGNADEVLKEYAETRERDEFLSRETEDLERSAQSLRAIIEELDKNIDERFKGGLTLIRTEFNAYFTELFSGGHATLELETPRIVSEDGEEQTNSLRQPADGEVAGLAVSVQLPRKQMRGLEVLSGGERALTSIALIFAMSQVNPPPFLILDETDAALDEANSRRYASIVETLAKRSQLILITHNRATMSAAGELYGVTMGQDGVSKLLSVKLDEAVQVAK